ncbi:MAG: GIY-YIG nuclease family protein [Microgenomates group bacterium]
MYILRSTSNQLYIGQTSNLVKRTLQHTNKHSSAAKFTKDGDNFKLVYKEAYPTRLDAMRRENQLKRWTRAKKEALLNGDFDKLKQLSRKTRV